MPLIVLTLGCAPSAADAYREALDDRTPLADALERCAESGDRRDECAAAVVRGRTEAVAPDCAPIRSEAWRAECFFTVAERHARARERWDALRTCAEAGRYYHECLYHAWTWELQGTIQGGRRPADDLAAAEEVIAFWGQIETIAGDPSAQIWRDWWYFALNRNPPARLSECAAFEQPHRTRCVDGTESFVARAVADFVQSPRTAPNLRDRLCRGDLEAMRRVLDDLYVAEPSAAGVDGASPTRPGGLDAIALSSRDRACPATRSTLERPWNPIFLERRTWVAG